MIAAGTYPPLVLTPMWDGTVRWRCTVCGTNGDGTHVPGSETCRLLIEERATKNRC